MEPIILDMSTHLVRAIVRIDEVDYALRHPDELTLAEQNHLRQWGQEIERSVAPESDGENLSKGEHALIEAVSLLMPDLPPAVQERLTDTQRLAILRGFTQLASQTGLASLPSGAAASQG
jgi:hypothetical protein